MEELHAAAMAYYTNGSQELRELVMTFFQSMDLDRDGRISRYEFGQFLQLSGYAAVNPNLFEELDRNRDGGLDFGEVLTWYYIVKTRGVSCMACYMTLRGLYFTCVCCFDTAPNTYDLCISCYTQRRFYHHHHHAYFMDNHMLLRSKRRLPPGFSNVNLALTVVHPQPIQPVAPTPDNRNHWWTTFRALEAALAIAGIAAGCNIM